MVSSISKASSVGGGGSPLPPKTLNAPEVGYALERASNIEEQKKNLTVGYDIHSRGLRFPGSQTAHASLRFPARYGRTKVGFKLSAEAYIERDRQ